jgi:hypothetical protein
MAKALTPTGDARRDQPVFQMTLLELVSILLEITDSEEETTRMAFELVLSGEVWLTGNFREDGPEQWH